LQVLLQCIEWQNHRNPGRTYSQIVFPAARARKNVV
jgi:hypothetical protein